MSSTEDASMDTTEAPQSGEEKLAEPKQFRLDITQQTKSAQNQHGLRHSDYQRYRQYCSRRLRRTRKDLGIPYPKNAFKKRVLTAETVTDSRYLTLPLMNAERAWSYAMQIKGEMTADTPRKRFHLLKRLSKAAKWSDHLKALCTETADPRTQLEAEAYSSWMNANVLLEADKHAEAVAKFTHAKMVYDQLGKIGGVSQQALCEEKVSSIELPLRYCNYILQRHGGQIASQDVLEMQKGGLDDLLQSKLQHVLEETRMRQAETLESVKWLGKEIPLKNPKIRVALITANDLSAQVKGASKDMDVSNDNNAATQDEKEGAKDANTLFGEIFSAYDDALSCVRADIRDAEEMKKKGAADPKTMEHLNRLKSYLTYNKLTFTKDRNLKLTQALTAKWNQQSDATETQVQTKRVKPDDLCNMYERLTANVQDQIDQGVTEDDDDLRNKLEAEKAMFTAFRCFFLAECYKKFGKWNEAGALFLRCQERIATAQQLNKGGNQQLNELDEEIKRTLCTLQAKSFLETQEIKAVVTKKMKNLSVEQKKVVDGQQTTLIDHLDSYKVSDNLVPFPPDFQATPAKPVLFDLAYNAVDYPDISARLPQAKGWLGGWFK